MEMLKVLIAAVMSFWVTETPTETEMPEPTPVVEQASYDEQITYEPQFIGIYKLTGYCPCAQCCGEYADGITSTGTTATEGRTIAVDPNVIPLGSEVMINGHLYIAEDIGGAIKENRIDIYKDNHSDCFSSECNGYAEVYLVRE